nr:unnamed protein product [Callosobruchus analis]
MESYALRMKNNKSKTEGLKTTFRTELKKGMAAQKTGSSTDDLYEPLSAP